jgi:hypothetical protein
MVRRFIIFSILMLTLITMLQLSRMVDEWHYIVPAQAGQVLYATSFDGGMPDWIQDERGGFVIQAINGVMQVIAQEDNTGPYALVTPYFGDFDVRVNTQIINGDFAGGNNNAFGIIFRRQDQQNYYIFLISGDGYYRVQRVDDGQSKDLSTWNRSAAINQGIDAVNALRVVGQADQFQFFVNETPIELCIPDDLDATSTIVGTECREGQWTTTLQDDTHAFGQIAVGIDAERANPLQYSRIVINFDDFIVLGPEDRQSTTTR